MKNILEKYNVSRETYDKLITFQNTVLKWNDKINLISKTSAENIWNRHIIDSLQLIKFIESKDLVLYDFGSGAGFPAIVLAIAGKQFFPNLKITLIESIGKKAMFLNEVKNILNLDINILQNRIEKTNLPKANIITSRALASLDKLLYYAEPFCDKNTKLIFPKGEKWQEELKTAQQKWRFEYTSFSSETNKNSCILIIKNIRRNKNG